ncbi:terminase [Roseateles sp.]|jgi:hypothetical protein|uniref:terminase n=1 Tax=Roseateles sp. TaxID=1971397 RepID=UPI0037CBD511
MTFRELIAHQNASYHRFHQRPHNLRIHLLTVPMCQLGNVRLLLAAGPLAWWWALLGAGLMLAAMAAKGRGHAGETEATEPFSGPLNVVQRILLEQWLTFPRFVLRGAWRMAFRPAPIQGEWT